ncbi:unnamed protein product [Linum trigynum]|uniref:Uncharacterized protein n=1 Tax=Linum trigynum TaxID=586398 RepID=A0AAV2F1X6_9ROSI
MGVCKFQPGRPLSSPPLLQLETKKQQLNCGSTVGLSLPFVYASLHANATLLTCVQTLCLLMIVCIQMIPFSLSHLDPGAPCTLPCATTHSIAILAAFLATTDTGKAFSSNTL